MSTNTKEQRSCDKLAEALRQPLTDGQIAEGRYRMWADELDDAPEPWSFLKGARWAQKACAEAWGVKLGTSGGEVQK